MDLVQGFLAEGHEVVHPGLAPFSMLLEEYFDEGDLLFEGPGDRYDYTSRLFKPFPLEILDQCDRFVFFRSKTMTPDEEGLVKAAVLAGVPVWLVDQIHDVEFL